MRWPATPWGLAVAVAVALGLGAAPAWGGEDEPDRGPHDDRAHQDPGPPRLDRAVEVLRELHPEMAERLEALRESSPQRLREMIPQRFPWLGHLIEMREKDPEMFRLRVRDMRLLRQSMGLAARVHRLESLAQGPPAGPDDAGPQPEATDAGPQALRAQLREVTAQRFEVRQQIRQRELAALESRIAELRQELEQREADRDALIDRYTRELVEQVPRWRERLERFREWMGPPGSMRGRWDGDRGPGDRDGERWERRGPDRGGRPDND